MGLPLALHDAVAAAQASGLGSVDICMADRVETLSLCHKAREEGKGGGPLRALHSPPASLARSNAPRIPSFALGDERNEVARAHSLNPLGCGLLGPMTALRLLAWGPPRPRRRALSSNPADHSATAIQMSTDPSPGL